MIRFIRRWILELAAAAAIVLGLFLLFEPYDLTEVFLTRLWIWLGVVIKGGVGTLRLIHLSDALGIALLVFAAVLLIKRSAQKIERSAEWSARACPICGHQLLRTRRRGGDIMARFLPLRRYRCRNCGWSGLRAKHSGHEDFAEPVPSGSSR